MKKQVTLTVLALATAMTATTAQADDIKISGKVFTDYGNQSSTTAGTTTDTQGANITRTYLTAKKKIDDTWSAKVTFDSAVNKGHTGKDNEVFLKTAQLTGKFSNELNVKVGLIGTPWIGYEDGLGKHRHVSKSYVDTHGMDSSADAGIGVFGKALDGMLSYDVVSINGGGYGATGRTDTTDTNIRVGVAPVKGLTIDLGQHAGYFGKTKATGDKTTLTQTMVTYGNEVDDLSYRVAVNLISNKKDTAGTTDKATEFWIWARKGDLGAYLRNESTNWDGKATDEKRTVVSLDYYAAKGVILSLVSDKSTGVKGVDGDEKSSTGIFTQFAF